MSLSWSNSAVRVHLGAGRLAACVLRGLGRRCVADKRLFPIEADGGASAFDALTQWLMHVAPKASVGWVLGHREVRYLMLPWAPEFSDSILCDAAARALFAQRFGLDPALFDVRMGPARHGRARLSAFVALDLLEDIQVHTRRSRHRLVGIEPGVAVFWSRFARRFAGQRGIARLIEADRQLILSHDGADIEKVVLAPSDAQELERMSQAGSGDVHWIFSSTSTTGEVPVAGERLVLPTVPGFDVATDGAYALALCGVLR